MRFITSTWGRRVYITYLAASVPALGFTSFVFLFLLFGSASQHSPDHGPDPAEDLSGEPWAFYTGLVSCLTFPFAWTATLLTSHRFDRPRWRTFNLLPVSGLLLLAAQPANLADGFGCFVYLAVLFGLLLAGIVLALLHRDVPAE